MLVYKTRNYRMERIMGAVDWLNVKLTGACIPFLFIGESKITPKLGIAVMATTLLYNLIRIYKEFKEKK